eukprot:6531591-Pyramimonas_sp.AAC.1
MMRGSPTATAVWVSAVTGAADRKLHGLRIAALEAEGRLPQEASVGLRLRATPRGAYRDPFVAHAVEVVKRWALAAGSDLPARGPMKAVWEEGRRFLEKPRPWAQCVDPAQATLLALSRVGVSMTSAFTL